MAWIKEVKRRGGTSTYWVHDRRDGRVVSIEACRSRAEAQAALEKYLGKRELEKEGYFDRFAK